MDAQAFLAALAPAMADAEARERFLADPQATLAAAGLDLPDWFPVTATEGEAPQLEITLAPLQQISDTDGAVSDEQLASVSGGKNIVDQLLDVPLPGTPRDVLDHARRVFLGF